MVATAAMATAAMAPAAMASPPLHKAVDTDVMKRANAEGPAQTRVRQTLTTARASDHAPEPTSGERPATAAPPPSVAVDFTKLPAVLEAAYSAYDPEGSIRPTPLKLDATWTRRSQPSILGKPEVMQLDADVHEREMRKAFDLLDALSRSGTLEFDAASLHVIVAATHHFDQSLMETVVEQNVNPIEKLEKTSLIVASTIHGVPAATLVQDHQTSRLRTYSAPELLAAAS